MAAALDDERARHRSARPSLWPLSTFWHTSWSPCTTASGARSRGTRDDLLPGRHVEVVALLARPRGSARRLERPADRVLQLLGRVRLDELGIEEELDPPAVRRRDTCRLNSCQPCGSSRCASHVSTAPPSGPAARRGAVSRARERRTRRRARGARRSGRAPTTRRRRGVTTTACWVPVASSTATMSATFAARVWSSIAVGRPDRPLPRPSKVTTRLCRARCGSSVFQIWACVIGDGGTSRTVGDPDPCTS